jgi:hypothetical protein
MFACNVSQHWQPTLRPNFKGTGTGFHGLGYSIDEKSDPAAQANSRFTAPIYQVHSGLYDVMFTVSAPVWIPCGRRLKAYPLTPLYSVVAAMTPCRWSTSPIGYNVC